MDRVSGWAKARAMLSNAGKIYQPGLYISNRCEYWWSTALPRDSRKIEDVDSSATDHAADATCYALNWEPGRFRAVKVRGMF